MFRFFDDCLGHMPKCGSGGHDIAWPKIRQPPAIQHEQKVAVLYRRKPMGDHNDRDVITQLRQCAPYQALGPPIKGARGLIQDKYPG
jgi:hypothetical protein